MGRGVLLLFLGWVYLSVGGGIFVLLPHHWGIPDTALLMVTYVAFRLPLRGDIYALLMGLSMDAFSGHPLGLNGSSKLLLFYLLRSLSRKFDLERWFIRPLVVAGAGMIDAGVIFILLRVAGRPLTCSVGQVICCSVTLALLQPLIFFLNDRSLSLWGRLTSKVSYHVLERR